MDDKIAIKVKNVNKTFKLPHEKHSSIKSMVIKGFRGKKAYERQEALKDISFDVKKGDFFGIVGRNGSGKSTLLKLIAGIYTPTQGHIQVNGKLTPFIELGVGFNPELTGRENVFLNGALFGFSRAEMESMYDEIVEFAELERFMDQKLKNYSSGMQVRLAFSIAIRAKGDILLLDEVLAVGDAAFQRKCFNYFNELKENKQTVVFVSHDLGSVRRFCNRAVVIKSGELIFSGSADDAVNVYSDQITEEIKKQLDQSHYSPSIHAERITKQAKILNGRVESRGSVKEYVTDEDFSIKFDVEFFEEALDPNPGIIIFNQQGFQVCSANSVWANCSTGKYQKGEKATFCFKFHNFLEPGLYKVMANVFYKNSEKMYVLENDLTEFVCKKDMRTGNILQVPYEFTFKKAGGKQ